MDAVTVARHSGRLDIRACPMLDAESIALHKAAVRSAGKVAVAIGAFLAGHDPKEQASWLKTAMTQSKDLFQPWNMEILYFIAVRGRARFSELEEVLGVSSRTLSNKLKLLTDAGFLERKLYDERPVRIEYNVTKHGLRTTSLAAPLFAHLNLVAVGRA